MGERNDQTGAFVMTVEVRMRAVSRCPFVSQAAVCIRVHSEDSVTDNPDASLQSVIVPVNALTGDAAASNGMTWANPDSRRGPS